MKNRCPQCGHSPRSSIHRRHCLGLAPKRRKRTSTFGCTRAGVRLAIANALATPAGSGRIVADGSFFADRAIAATAEYMREAQP